MSDSEVMNLLSQIVKEGGKVWVAKRIGRRISYIEGLKAGEELFLPPEVLYDDGQIIVFCEGIKNMERAKNLARRVAAVLEGGDQK